MEKVFFRLTVMHTTLLLPILLVFGPYATTLLCWIMGVVIND